MGVLLCKWAPKCHSSSKVTGELVLPGMELASAITLVEKGIHCMTNRIQRLTLQASDILELLHSKRAREREVGKTSYGLREMAAVEHRQTDQNRGSPQTVPSQILLKIVQSFGALLLAASGQLRIGLSVLAALSPHDSLTCTPES